MKRFRSILRMFAVVALVAAAGTLSASAKEKMINRSALPKAAQTTLTKYFGNEKISRVKQDTSSFGVTEYEVDFTSGREIEFDATGTWKSIDCKNAAVPSALVPAQIQKYISSAAPGAKIVSIEKDRGGYDVKLNNKREYKFDRNGNFRYSEYD